MILKNLFIGQQERKAQRIDLWTWQRGRAGEMYGKSNMETYIAAAAAKSLQSCLTLCDPIGGPPGSPVPGILQARTLEQVAISFSISICKIDSQWKFAVQLRKLKQGLCINLEGWDGEGDGREVQKGERIYVYLWLIHVEVWPKTTKLYKAIILQ